MSRIPPLRITFLGIGAVDLPMAEQLLVAEFDVTGVDPFADQRAKAAARGLRAEETPVSAAEANVVVCMVATPEQLRTAGLGGAGVLQHMREGSVVVLMSTIGPRRTDPISGRRRRRS